MFSDCIEAINLIHQPEGASCIIVRLGVVRLTYRTSWGLPMTCAHLGDIRMRQSASVAALTITAFTLIMLSASTVTKMDPCDFWLCGLDRHCRDFGFADITCSLIVGQSFRRALMERIFEMQLCATPVKVRAAIAVRFSISLISIASMTCVPAKSGGSCRRSAATCASAMPSVTSGSPVRGFSRCYEVRRSAVPKPTESPLRLSTTVASQRITIAFTP